MLKLWLCVLLVYPLQLLSQDILNDSLITFDDYRQEGVTLIDRGKYLSATIKFKDLLKKYPDAELDKRIEITYFIGNAYQNARLLDSAKYYYQKGDVLCTEVASNYSKSLKYHSKASFYFTRSEIDSAMVNALKSLDYALLTKNQKQKIKSESAVGLIFLSQKDYRKASIYLRKARELADQLNDSLQIAFTETYLGQLEMEQGIYDKAERHFNMAIPVFERRSNIKGILIAKGHLSKSYFFQGKTNDAVNIGQELLPIMNEMEVGKDLGKMISNTNAIAKLENES